jgi:hypothetical protein
LPTPFEEEFFLGGWCPNERLQLDMSSSGRKLQTVIGSNWFLLAPVSPISGRSLVHPSTVVEGKLLNATAFRGYITHPPIHTWSDSEAVLSAWNNQHPPFNGSFAAARILDEGRAVELTADALGIAPLYYREVGRLLLFATNSRFLCLSGDELDRFAGRNLIQSRFAWGDSGLTSGVRKVSPGVQLKISGDGIRRSCWFDYGSLPPGDEPINSNNLADLEASFQTAIERLLALGFGKIALPLSGGNDSRRILSPLVARNVDFESYSVRVFHDGRDMDASFAANLAKHFGFPHQIVELPRGSEFAELDRLRRALVDGEGVEHTWWLPMGKNLGHSKMLFDGLAGDITSYSFYNTEQAIGTLSVTDKVLRPSYWPSATEASEYLESYLSRIPKGNNRDTLSFLFLRTRTGPGLMATRLLPLGNLAVFPFMDLDYLKNALRFDPRQKATKATSLQQRCLHAFWPEYAQFPNTASNPPQVEPTFRKTQRDHWAACLRQLNREAMAPMYGELNNALSVRARATAIAAPFYATLSAKIRWWLEPFLTLASRQNFQNPAWHLE